MEKSWKKSLKMAHLNARKSPTKNNDLGSSIANVAHFYNIRSTGTLFTSQRIKLFKAISGDDKSVSRKTYGKKVNPQTTPSSFIDKIEMKDILGKVCFCIWS